MKRKIALLLPLIAALPFTANAATTPWSQTEGGKLRLIALPPEKDGTVHATLEISPNPGWHTYWKVPGSSGIPPQITVQAGGNINLEKVDFPAPRIFSDGTLRDFGYDSTVMLPLTLKQTDPGKPSKLNADVFVGLCGQVCIPFKTDLTLTVDSNEKPVAREIALVNAARALLPEPPASDFKVESSSLSPDGRTVTLTIVLPAGADAHAARFIVTGNGGEAFREAQIVKQEGHSVTISATPVFIESGKTLRREPVELLAESAGRTMQTSVIPQ